MVRTQTRRTAVLLAMFCWVVWIAEVSPVAAASDGNGEQKGVAVEAAGPRKWALLIGVEKYHRANPLHFTVNDVTQLSDTLRNRGDYSADNILKIVDTESNPRFQPLRSSLMREIPDFLKNAGPEDHMLVYFSGHGFRDKSGKLYLAPIDCDPSNPAPTGIAVEWFRQQLGNCKAKFKLLVLDACHAGTEKGTDKTDSVSTEDLGTPFRELENVVTLASSSSDEKSQIWDEKKQSLFSYWLNQGLRGRADLDSDGVVTVDELYNYVHRHVTKTAKTQFPAAQTPVRIVHADTPGVPEVVRLKPQGLKTLLADIAEQLAWSLEDRQIKKVGVLEFTSDTKLGELLGADFGALGRYCGDELERQLIERAGDKFGVVDHRRLQDAVAAQKFGLKDLASDEALRGLSQKAGGMPAIALGTLRNRTGRVVTLQCRLLQTEQDDVAGATGGLALLNESEWAMLGHSAWVKPEDRMPERPMPGRPARPVTAQLIGRLDQRAEEPHPLMDPKFPYRVKIMLKDAASGQFVERKGVFRGNDLFVPLSKGEVYEIWVENHSGQLVVMRLLVDGLNTMVEKQQATKGVAVEPVDRKEELVVGKRVNLSDARPWILDPKDSDVFRVAGFVKKIGSDGEWQEFRVVDAQASLAARQSFTDQIGLITAAFYAPSGGSRGPVGTEAGETQSVNLEEVKDSSAGNLLGVVNIRYVEPEALPAER